MMNADFKSFSFVANISNVDCQIVWVRKYGNQGISGPKIEQYYFLHDEIF